jgi:Fis family transcriptional regulator
VKRALVLPDTAAEVVGACEAAGLEIVRVATVPAGRTLLARGGGFAFVDGRVASPRSLEEEIHDRLELFFERLRDHEAAGLYASVMREVERPLIACALARSGGIRTAAAEALGIDRGTLSRRIRALGIEEDE